MFQRMIYGFMVMTICLGMHLAAQERISRDKILNAGPSWQEAYAAYRVDESMLDTLKTQMGSGLCIDVYLALWCHDSQVNLPVFIKIVDALGRTGLQVNYYTCKRKASRDVKYYVESRKVERIPTFIFTRQDVELGRIVENPRTTLLQDILDIID